MKTKIERCRKPRGQLKRIDRTPTLDSKRSRLLAPILRRLKGSSTRDGWVSTRDLLKVVPGTLRSHAIPRSHATATNDVLRDAVSRGLVQRVYGFSRLTSRGRRVA
jgi:hypothetical protein